MRVKNFLQKNSEGGSKPSNAEVSGAGTASAGLTGYTS
jgi:hypothetical protein